MNSSQETLNSECAMIFGLRGSTKARRFAFFWLPGRRRDKPPLSMPLHFSAAEWLLAIVGALSIGISKNGFAGLSMVTVIIMAHLFPPRESTGVVLPLLIFGDVCAILGFKRHAQWAQVRRMLPPTLTGVVLGWLLMRFIPGQKFGPVIGWIVLAMTLLQALRKIRPALFEHLPHSRGFAWSMGGGAGITTMLANAAGPIMALYFLAINLPKYEFIGTSAWFFFFVNTFKIPFSFQLGLIHGGSLLFNLMLAPAVAAGAFLGRSLVAVIPQRLFETLLLIFAGLASLRFIGLF